MPYQYKVKIMIPAKRKRGLTRVLHGFTSKIVSLSQMKQQIQSELKDEFQSNKPIEVGYFKGQLTNFRESIA